MDILRLMSSETQTHNTSRELPSPVGDSKSLTTQKSVRLELEDLYCILQIEPNDSLIAMELAKRMVASGRWQEVHKLLLGIIKIDYRFESVHQLGQVEYQLDLLSEAMEHLNEALGIAPEVRPEFFDLFKTLGNIHVRSGDLDSAEDCYNRAYRINHSSDLLMVNFGTLYIQRQNWSEAVDRFRRAIELNSTNDKAWIGLALGHRMMGDFELAWGNLEAALEYNALNEVALGLALDWGAQDGREFRILEMIRTYLINGGWSERMSLAFAWLSWRRGDKWIARLELERIVAVNPANTRALEMIEEMRGPK